MKSLQKFARAFDVNLNVSFESFSRGILDVANLNREQLEVKSREVDLLTSFTDHTTFVHSSGEWKAINHLHIIKNTVPGQPIKPIDDAWQSLGRPEELIAL